jgi:hypothetical protein
VLIGECGPHCGAGGAACGARFGGDGFLRVFPVLVLVAYHGAVFLEPVANVREMQKPVLPQSDIDECSFDAGHHLGDFPKVDITDHLFLIGSLDEQFCQATIFRNCNTGFVGASVDDDFLLHAVLFVPTFL